METLCTAAHACSGRIRRWGILLVLPAVMMMAMAADCSAKGHLLIDTKNSEGARQWYTAPGFKIEHYAQTRTSLSISKAGFGGR